MEAWWGQGHGLKGWGGGWARGRGSAYETAEVLRKRPKFVGLEQEMRLWAKEQVSRRPTSFSLCSGAVPVVWDRKEIEQKREKSWAVF